MNPTELKTLADTLIGIADGKPWQSRLAPYAEWTDESPTTDVTSCLFYGAKIRLKPWELGRSINGHTLPPGASWHRSDFTEDMLPAPYRPIMFGEDRAGDDEVFGFINKGPWRKCGELNSRFHDSEVGPQHNLSRTTRPIPFTLTPEQIADGWLPWSGGECPVEPESQPEIMLRGKERGQVRRAIDAAWGIHKNPEYDIIAYRPDPYGKFRQALADGKTVQCMAYPYKFIDIESPSFDAAPDQYRIKPEPQWLPLGPEDVPPLSMIRRKGQTDEYGKPQYWHWRLISYVTGIGPVCADRGYNWQELSTDYKINRPRHRDADGNPTLWEPCRKLSNV